jgi:hypothetical protein
MSLTVYIFLIECSPSPSITIIHNYKLNTIDIPYGLVWFDSKILRHYDLMKSFVFCYFAKRTWIWLSSKEINHSIFDCTFVNSPLSRQCGNPFARYDHQYSISWDRQLIGIYVIILQLLENSKVLEDDAYSSPWENYPSSSCAWVFLPHFSAINFAFLFLVAYPL